MVGDELLVLFGEVVIQVPPEMIVPVDEKSRPERQLLNIGAQFYSEKIDYFIYNSAALGHCRKNCRFFCVYV
jgi:hypothetical protein